MTLSSKSNLTQALQTTALHQYEADRKSLCVCSEIDLFLSLDFFSFYSVTQSYRCFSGELVIFLKLGEDLGSALLP